MTPNMLATYRRTCMVARMGTLGSARDSERLLLVPSSIGLDRCTKRGPRVVGVPPLVLRVESACHGTAWTVVSWGWLLRVRSSYWTWACYSSTCSCAVRETFGGFGVECARLTRPLTEKRYKKKQ